MTSVYLDAEDMNVVVWHGVVSAAEWEHFVRGRLADDLDWPRGRRHLADLSTSNPDALTSEDLDHIVGLLATRMHRITGRRQAIVASLGWDLARVFEQRLDRLGATTIVFNSLPAACAWLGADPETVSAITSRLRDDLRSPANAGAARELRA